MDSIELYHQLGLYALVEDKTVERKWEVITKSLRKINELELYQLANKMDEALKRLYGEHLHTKAWIECYKKKGIGALGIPDWNSLTISQIWAFYARSDYCTACGKQEWFREDKQSCETCEFGEELGVCTVMFGEEPNAYKEFQKLMKDRTPMSTDIGG